MSAVVVKPHKPGPTTADRRPDIWNKPKNSPTCSGGARRVSITRSAIWGAPQKQPVTTATAQNIQRSSANAAAATTSVQPTSPTISTRLDPKRLTKKPVAIEHTTATISRRVTISTASPRVKSPTLTRYMT